MPHSLETHYATSAAALDYYNEYGNLADPPRSLKRSSDVFLEGSGFISPPKTMRNPWKRRKTD
jgi:hypothetical protein